MEAMIILRSYGGPQKLLARTLLIRSPKRKSIWIFQNVINSIFQQCEKETSSGLAAEESDCTGRALACSAATTRSKGRDGQQRGPLTRAGKGGRAALSVGAPFMLPISLCLAARCPPHGQLHWGQEEQPFLKVSFSLHYTRSKKIILGQACLMPNFGLNATVCRTVLRILLRVFVLILVF